MECWLAHLVTLDACFGRKLWSAVCVCVSTRNESVCIPFHALRYFRPPLVPLPRGCASSPQHPTLVLSLLRARSLTLRRCARA